MITSEKSKKKKDKSLPWWVELLFVQIGLPDKLLVNILKTRKRTRELIKNDKKSLMITLLAISTFAYFYPVIKHAKNKLDCEATAEKYIINNKTTISFNKKELEMISTNFCYGGDEIYKLENSKN